MRRCAALLLVAACGGAKSRTIDHSGPAPAAVTSPPEDLPSTGDPWAGRSDLLAPPAPVPATPVALPKVERFTLPNGLKVLVVASKDLPIVSLRLAVRAGNEDETRERRLIADYAAMMLTRGTGRRDADAIASTMDFIGGRLSGSADLEATYVTCEALAKDLATCLTMLPEVVIGPSFSNEEMQRIAERLAAILGGIRDNPEALAVEHLDNLLWGDDHVRGFPATVDGVRATSRKDLQTWHQTHFVPSNAVLAVAGDVDVTRLRADLGRVFGPWKGKAAPAPKAWKEPKPQGIKVRLVDNPDLTQSQIVVGGLGIAHGDKDYLAALLVNYSLGGGAFSSRLMTALRVKGGKTYGASSDFERWRTRGAWIAKTVTRTPETAATLKLVLDEVARMAAEGPTAEELAAAKASLAGSYATSLQSATEIAAGLLRAELHGLGDDWVRNYPLKVDAVTLDEARAAAKARLDAGDLAVVIVGKADEIAPQLAQANVPFERVGYLEAVSVKDRGKRPAAGESFDPRRSAAGKKLLDAALAAKGGAGKLRAVKDVVATGKATISVGGQKVSGSWTRMLAPPASMAVQVAVPGLGNLKMTITPQAVFQTGNGKTQDLPPAFAEQARGGLWRNHDLILLRHLEEGTQVTEAGRQKVDDKSYDVVIVRRADGSNETRILLDPASKLIFRLEYTEAGGPASEEYGSYKAVEGIQMPFRQRAQSASQVIDVEVTDIKVNGGTPAGAFERPTP